MSYSYKTKSIYKINDTVIEIKDDCECCVKLMNVIAQKEMLIYNLNKQLLELKSPDEFLNNYVKKLDRTENNED